MGMPRNKAPLGTSSKGKADEHKSTWINTMQCSESALGGEVCSLHCGNPRGKLLISFSADGTGARKSFTEEVELLPQRVERLISRVLI